MNTFTPERRRTTGDGMTYHVVDTTTDRFGVTRCEITVANDVRYLKAANLLPVIPGFTDEWEYSTTFQPGWPNLLATHHFIFRGRVAPKATLPEPGSFYVICDACGDEFEADPEDDDRFTYAFRCMLHRHTQVCRRAHDSSGFRLGGF